MKKILLLLLAALPVILPAAQTATEYGNYVHYTGTGANDDDVVIESGDLGGRDACTLMSLTGAVDVFVLFDSTSTWSTAALSLQDFGAIVNEPVLVTVAGRVYGFVGKYRKVRILQNGATATSVVLNCWKL